MLGYVKHLVHHGSMQTFYTPRVILCSCAFSERNTMALLASAKLGARLVSM